MAWILCGAYLAIGAVAGLILEEQQYRRSSECWRSPGDYAFSAFACAIIWPIMAIVAQSDASRKRGE